MKNQALFSLKDKSKKLKCRLLQFLFGALRVKTWNGNEWDGKDTLNSTGYSLLQDPEMVLLQKRICSLRGSKFFP